MKTILNKLVILLLAACAGFACTEHTEYDDTGFSAVEKLLYPSDGEALELIEQADANLYFEWQVAKVGTPVYTVVFMDAANKEIGRYLADNNGQKSSLKMLHSQLNMIAAEAGAVPDGTGDIYWTVCAGLGNAEILSSAEPHKLTVKRYASVAAPYHLYVTGEGSEFGDDPVAAKKMRELGDGKFEIYTEFDGAFNFINRNEPGNKRTFGVEEGRLTEGGDATASAQGVYRVLVDFKAGTVKMEKIESLKYHWCWTPDEHAVMEYSGNGTWRMANFKWNGGDNRYRFDAVIDGVKYIWGYSSANMEDKDMPQGLTGDQYKLSMRETGSISQWDYGYKHISALQGVTCTLVVDCSPEADAYYHWYEFDFAPEATPVTLTAPADGAALALNAQADARATFSWVKLPDSDPAGKLTTYSLVFYADAAKTREVSRKDAQYNASLNVTYVDLEAIAASADIEAEGTGDIYWAVESKLLSWTALSDVRKLTVTRMKGIPAKVYISGSASEYGSNPKQLKALGAGKFEIYTKLTAGRYSIADGTSADARTFVVDGGSIAEGSGGSISSEEAVYRITLDFAGGTARFEKVTEMKYDFKMSGHVVMLDYQGDGVWGKNNFDATNGGNDTRYYLTMKLGDTVMRLCNKDRDYSGNDPDDFAAEGDSKFFVYLNENSTLPDWDYYFKFPRSYRNSHNTISLKINLSSSADNYYNYVTDQTIF